MPVRSWGGQTLGNGRTARCAESDYRYPCNPGVRRSGNCNFQRNLHGSNRETIVQGTFHGLPAGGLLGWYFPDDFFSNINKQYGKQLVFVDASFQLNPGEKVGLVGPNGAGKTSFSAW